MKRKLLIFAVLLAGLCSVDAQTPGSSPGYYYVQLFLYNTQSAPLHCIGNGDHLTVHLVYSCAATGPMPSPADYDIYPQADIAASTNEFVGTITAGLSPFGWGEADTCDITVTAHGPDFAGSQQLTVNSWSVGTITFQNLVNACETNLCFSVHNSDVVSHTYYQSRGVPNGVSDLSGVITLSPGQSGQSVAEWQCTDAPNVRLYMEDNGGDTGTSGTSSNGSGSGTSGTSTNGSGSGTYGGDIPQNVTPTGSDASTTNQPVVAPPTSTTAPTPGQFNPTNSAVSGSDSPILFSGTNTQQTVAQGDSAIYDALAKGIQQQHQDMQNLDSTISNAVAGFNSGSGGKTNNDIILNWPSNLLAGAGSGSGSPTNVGTGTGTNTGNGGLASNVWVMNWPTNGWYGNTNGYGLTNYAQESTLEGISNLLAGAGSTNGESGTNWLNGITNGDGTSWVVDPGITNWSQALAVSAGPLDFIESWFTTTVAGMVVPTIDEGGTPSPMILDFGNFGIPGKNLVIDFNPLTFTYGGQQPIQGLFYQAKMLIQWLITVYYLKRCLVDSRWALSVINQAHGSVNKAQIKQLPGPS